MGITRDKQGAGADFYVEELGNRKIFYKCNWERNCIGEGSTSDTLDIFAMFICPRVKACMWVDSYW